PAPAPGPMPAGTMPLTLQAGQVSVNHQLTPTDPQDRNFPAARCKTYTIQLTAGKTYQIDMVRVGATTLDPYLCLEDANGRTLLEDDDSGGNLNSRIVFNCTRTDNYRVVATSFNGSLGPYVLTVQQR